MALKDEFLIFAAIHGDPYIPEQCRTEGKACPWAQSPAARLLFSWSLVEKNDAESWVILIYISLSSQNN